MNLQKCIKPCPTCPFRRSALLGLWDPAHLLMTYLDSATRRLDPVGRMGCHKWNGRVGPGAPDDSPPCGGWVRVARDAAALPYDPPEVPEDLAADLYDSVEEMLEANGLDVGRLPPRAPPKDDFVLWYDAMHDLRMVVGFVPEFARAYVVPGSPLDLGVTGEEIEEFMGIPPEVLDDY